MQEDREAAGRLRVEQLRQPGGDHARQHVARCRRGHARIAGGIDEDAARPASRSPSGGPSARRRHDAWSRNRRPPRCRFACTSSTVMPDQPRHLAGMRRDDHVALFPARAAARARRPAASARPHRARAAPSARSTSARTNPAASRVRPSPGPHAMTSCVQLQHAVDRGRRHAALVLRQRLGHELGRHRGDDRQAATPAWPP